MVISKPKAIFFDLFGTLLTFRDFDQSQFIWTEAFYRRVGKPNGLSQDQITAICNQILIESSPKEPGLTTYETKIRNNFLRLKINIPQNELKLLADESVSNWQNCIDLAVDTIEILAFFQTYLPLCLISNFDHSPHVRRLLSKYGIDKYFDRIIISDDVNCSKPDPEIFQIALNYFNINPGDAIHVGDSPIDDIEGALSAGIKPILIERKSKSHIQDKKEFIEVEKVSSLSELKGKISITCR